MSGGMSSAAKKDSIRVELEVTRAKYRVLMSPLSAEAWNQNSTGSRRTVGDGPRFA